MLPLPQRRQAQGAVLVRLVLGRLVLGLGRQVLLRLLA